MNNLLRSLDDKYGERIGWVVVVVPYVGFMLYIEAITWNGILVAAAGIGAAMTCFLLGVGIATGGYSELLSRKHLRGRHFISSAALCACCAAILYRLGKLDDVGYFLVASFVLGAIGPIYRRFTNHA